MCINKYLIIPLAFSLCAAQLQHEFVAYTNSADATAYNNSHKIVPMSGDIYSDTIHVVYHSSDSVYYVYTTDQGQSWQTPVAIYAGEHPAMDVDIFGLRHLAWQYYDTNNNNYEIYYDCLDDWSPPLNVSETPTNSTLPDSKIDIPKFERELLISLLVNPEIKMTGVGKRSIMCFIVSKPSISGIIASTSTTSGRYLGKAIFSRATFPLGSPPITSIFL